MNQSDNNSASSKGARCPFSGFLTEKPHAAAEPIAESKPEPAIGLAQLLKEGTAALHDQAENAAFQRRMVDGGLLREEFIDFLNQVLIVHRTLDPLLSEAAKTDERVGAMYVPDHRRVSRIEADIERLGGTVGAAALGSTERFVMFVEQAAMQNPVALVGVLYVNEGATNGNKVVAKRLRDGLGLHKEFALDYLDPHGADQRKRWMAFKSGLDELAMTEEERELCLESAKATFRLFMEMSAEMAEGTAV